MTGVCGESAKAGETYNEDLRDLLFLRKKIAPKVLGQMCEVTKGAENLRVGTRDITYEGPVVVQMERLDEVGAMRT